MTNAVTHIRKTRRTILKKVFMKSDEEETLFPENRRHWYMFKLCSFEEEFGENFAIQYAFELIFNFAHTSAPVPCKRLHLILQLPWQR